MVKKLFLILILSFISAQSLAAPSIFSCEVKQNLAIRADSVREIATVDSFIFKDEIDYIVFSENRDKRPAIVLDNKLKIIESRRNSSEFLNISGEEVATNIPFSFVYYLKDDFGYLSIAFSRSGNALVMIARCVAF
jgi:hypothetical protein